MSRRIAENPFYVLELRPDATHLAVEMAGQKLLGMLELGLAGARSYPTPLGPRRRDAERVRQAMAELRDPDKRLVHEIWARLDPVPGVATAAPDGDGDPLAPWEEAPDVFGR